MKPKVIVEQLNSHEHIWDNSLLKLPTILSSPSLDCSSQYKEMLSIVAAELESDIPGCGSDSIILLESPCNNLKNLNITHKTREIRIQRNQQQSLKYNCKHSSRCKNAVQSKPQTLQPQPISDPFDDFVNLDDTQQLLNNCNVFHNFSSHYKVERSSTAFSLRSTIFEHRLPLDTKYPYHSEP
ncbi:hypothetical protein ACHWQZ_G004007 [Mnemiopsis leidyi]